MSIISEILDHNKTFVERKEYAGLPTDRFPNKGLVILTCMDTRLIDLLPRAMNVHGGEIKIIKNAGAIVSHPFGSIMRSILVAVYQLHATEICVVGHHDCGMTGLDCGNIIEKAKGRGISDVTLNTLKHAGINLQDWLKGFDHVRDGVEKSVSIIHHHPLLPHDVKVHGLIIHPETGKLDPVVDGYSVKD